MRTLDILSKKLKFVEVDPTVKASKALNDVQPELEKLRQKAVSKVNLIHELHIICISLSNYSYIICMTSTKKILAFFNPLSTVVHIILY